VYLFEAPTSYDKDAVAKKWKVGESAQLMKEWRDELSKLEQFAHDDIDAAFKNFLQTKSLGMGAVMPLFRLMLTGTLTGPSSMDVAALIGKEEVLSRIDSGVTILG
jgi:glutamyl-tRNA synthetase